MDKEDAMSLKDLLVIVDNDPTCASRIDIALALAAEHGAHLTGLHVMPWPLTQFYSEMPIPESVEKVQRLELEEAARRGGGGFSPSARAGPRSPRNGGEPRGTSCTWRGSMRATRT